MLKAPLLLLLIAASLAAQSISGSISGSVLDPSGGAIAGALVTLVSDQTHETRTTSANEVGAFTFFSLLPGAYSATVAQSGFQGFERTGMNLSANERLSLGAIRLKIGDVTDKVTVEAVGSAVQTTSSERAAQLTSSQINMVLVRGRDVLSLLRLLPGVSNTTDPNALGDGTGAAMPYIQGQQYQFNTFNVDGVAGNDLGNPYAASSSTNMDAIAEVTVLLNNYQAEYGRNGGAFINIVTKSGTRNFHGTGYWYKRHEMFNANDFFSNRNGVAKALYRYNTLGATIGGPLYIPKVANGLKDKLFFFYSFENWASFTPRPLSQITVPTALERQGNFSQTLDLNGQVIPIKDPLTGSPFQGNAIPASRLNKNGQALLNVFPLPNVLNRGITQGNYNYNFLTSFEVPKHNHLGKMDYQPTANDHIWVRASNWWADNQGYGAPAGFNGGWPSLSTHYLYEDHGGAVNYTRTLNPSMVNEFNSGVRHSGEFTAPVDPAGLNKFVRSNLGMTLGQLYPQNNALNLIPQASFGGVPSAPSIGYDGRTFLHGADTVFDFSDTFSWIHGAHSLKFGMFAERARAAKGSSGNFGGNFAFARDVNNPLDSNYAYSNAVLGIYDTYTEDQSKPTANERHLMVEWFAQDAWKVTRRLTLDYGMRFAWATPWSIKDGKSAGFALSRYDPSNAPLLYQPAFDSSGVRIGRNAATGQTVPQVLIGSFVPNSGNVLNGMVVGTDPTYPTGFMVQQPVHPEPRFGFAYDVFGDGNTAIRGGFGITHVTRTSSNTPNTQARINPPQQFSPVTYYGTMDTLLGATGYLSPTTVYGWDKNTKTPSLYNYTMGIQHKFGHATVVEASYVGNVGRHITWARNLNLVPYGARFLAQNADPTNPKIPLPDKFFAPLPGYSGVNYVENAGTTNYNSLQATANRRFTSTLQFGFSYTWSKAMSYDDYDWAQLVATYRPRRVWNYGKASYDQTQNFTFNYIWDLPKPIKTWRNPVVRQALDNWQLAGFSAFVSGLPLGVGYTLVDGADLTGGGDGGRINVTGKAQLSQGDRSFSKWFNTSVFARPAKGDYGNAPKDVFRGPGINNWDISLFKKFPLRSEARFFTFRWEMYNAFNHTQFAAVDNTARFDALGNQVNARLGQVIGTRSPRVMQGSLRFTF